MLSYVCTMVDLVCFCCFMQRKGQSDVASLSSSADVVRPQDPLSTVQDKLKNTSSSSSQKQRFVVIGSPSLPKRYKMMGLIFSLCQEIFYYSILE